MKAMKGIRSASEPYAKQLASQIERAARPIGACRRPLWIPAPEAGMTRVGSAAYSNRRQPPSLLPERAHQLVAQRLHQVRQHGAVAGLHEGTDRHARG